ncbi:hypothetical protein BO78DRAFT_412682 [Aspergillus sclerotiicarbonarius CBS 121057]|uniref:Uncharacterized protein n=1 Tax=Aspergillus sclerotiicarbonarius (strain CBS 121057 / IBT 28362) TaxID=1448318 RepID=A0A319EQG1_ASPSB|nr:hypothetical protein BO78DRAFT_412682 [Aspergillus sclerotiicarbonarius CBS 121057]
MGVGREAIIFFVILGCVAATITGYSIHYLMTNGFYGTEKNLDPPPEQKIYMRQLRLRDLHWMARDHGVKYELPWYMVFYITWERQWSLDLGIASFGIYIGIV